MEKTAKKARSVKPPGPFLRVVFALAMWIAIFWRKARLPWKWLPKGSKQRSIHEFWTTEMMVNYAKSWGTKLATDQICPPIQVDNYEPLAEVDPEYRLSPEEIEEFYQNGFLTPFTVVPPEEMEAFGDRLLAEREKVNETYGFVCDRDRHFNMPEMMRIMADPAITERLAQLLGPDIVAWRSQIFHKPPGNNPVGWHQATTFMFEEGFMEPLIFPPDKSKLFQLTVWIPADPATLESGCLKFETGSQFEGTRWMRLGGKVGFHAVNYYPDYEVDELKVKRVEMQPGQALIFSERTIHGSDANKSGRNRLAFNFRVVPENVRAYPPGKRFHNAAQMDEVYDLKDYHPIQLRGENKSGVNDTVPWKQYAGEETAAKA